MSGPALLTRAGDLHGGAGRRPQAREGLVRRGAREERAIVRRVEDERAGGEPALRPSVVTSLLRVRRHNEDQGATNLRLFEFASAFHYAGATHVERPTLALVADAPVDTRDGQASSNQSQAHQGAYRLMRGVVERVLSLAAPRLSRVEFVRTDDTPWLTPAARVLVDGVDIGGLLGRRAAAGSEKKSRRCRCS